MEEEEQEETGFKIKDKRRFDSTGNLREQDGDSSASKSQPDAEPAMAQESQEQSVNESGSQDGQGYDPVQIDFSSFVLSLATQAMVQLGEMPAPGGAQIPQDTAAARQSIDILNMLEEKTKGNLTAAEEALLGEIVHNLRLTYVAKTKG